MPTGLSDWEDEVLIHQAFHADFIVRRKSFQGPPFA
jgi:hypothetical protein